MVLTASHSGCLREARLLNAPGCCTKVEGHCLPRSCALKLGEQRRVLCSSLPVPTLATKFRGQPQLHFDSSLSPAYPLASCDKLGSTECSASPSSGVGPLTYRDAGVDIDAGTELVRRIARMTPGIGGFGGLYPFGDSYLVAGTDGVGTKLKLAFALGIHDTIGIDLVAMSVNDIVTSGAEPLFFLDYFATSRLDVDQAELVIKGIVEGCKQAGCALLGGETAEMPGFYADGEYDLSGFAVGAVKKDALINGSGIAVGDCIVGLPSSGVHSNGFSLVRRVLEASKASLHDVLPGGDGTITIGQALLAPTRIYVRQVMDFVRAGGVKGIAHITGGGFTDNIPRIFPVGLAAEVHLRSWMKLPIFDWLQEAGQIEPAEMRRTFNLGIGMVLVMTPEAASLAIGNGGQTFCIGKVISGSGVVYVDE